MREIVISGPLFFSICFCSSTFRFSGIHTPHLHDTILSLFIAPAHFRCCHYYYCYVYNLFYMLFCVILFQFSMWWAHAFDNVCVIQSRHSVQSFLFAAIKKSYDIIPHSNTYLNAMAMAVVWRLFEDSIFHKYFYFLIDIHVFRSFDSINSFINDATEWLMDIWVLGIVISSDRTV